MKFGQLIEYNKENTFFFSKFMQKTSSKSFLKKV